MNRIRELRKQRKMTQKELSKHLQIADSTLSYWEQGKYEPDINALKELSRFFHVSIDYILGGDMSEWKENNSSTESLVEEVKPSYKNPNKPKTSLLTDLKSLTHEEIVKIAEYVKFIKSLREKN